MSQALLLPDTFQYIQALKKVGFEEKQAEKIVETINAVDTSPLATKKDVELVVAQLESRLVTTITTLLLGQAAVVTGLVVGLIQYLK